MSIGKETGSTLYIRNMVCNRCIKVVEEEFKKLGLNIRNISLGEVVVDNKLSEGDVEKIRMVLEENGFELIENRKMRIIEQIKILILDLVRDEEKSNQKLTLSEYLAENLKADYNYLSTLFSSVENITIEHYLILQKIERAKELLKYGELTLSEIAYKLGYSSVAHLSAQFKKVTGMNANQFKSLTENTRKSLDKVK
ncbi:MAG TPA: AraC family transcriptional regulator [Ignavibacteriaceae bacterium]|nr:AraC family transcriptional regulator [Ignavibacteriaceae bacterium]